MDRAESLEMSVIVQASAGAAEPECGASGTLKGGKQLRPVRVPPSALDLSELGHELTTVGLAGDGLTLRVKA
jgi:hypothetical protein